MTVAESESNVRITTHNPYLTHTGKLWGAYCEDFGENWACYNGTTLYASLGLSVLNRLLGDNSILSCYVLLTGTQYVVFYFTLPCRWLSFPALSYPKQYIIIQSHKVDVMGVGAVTQHSDVLETKPYLGLQVPIMS